MLLNTIGSIDVALPVRTDPGLQIALTLAL
jgi:hypothetical protein